MFIIQNNNDLLHSSYTPTHFLECGTPPINIDLILENAGGILSLSLIGFKTSQHSSDYIGINFKMNEVAKPNISTRLWLLIGSL